MTDLIEEIQKQNVKLYGATVLQEDMPYHFRIITEKVYSDRTHFVYELLQNAEDACERKRKSTGEKDFKICFKLSKEGLEVRHNGIIFQDGDIKRICDIEEKDIKEGGMIQIGKFGIGFKSVYAYTQSPKIYSGDNSFYIKNLVLPYRVERRTDLTDGETLFFIPFNHKEITPEEAYEKIGYRLKNLGMRTLLFLRNISEISWEMDGFSGKYLRTCEFKDGYRWVTLHKDDKIDEKWLVFEKPIQADDNGRLMEVAYLVKEDVDKNTRNIVKAENTKLVTYFPTEKETHLHFLIQAPFNTTATRENILDDNLNKTLISEISDFVAETITKVKSLKLLDVGFLNTLPIEIEYFSEETNLFRPIYDKVKEKLSSEEELLPTSDNEFVSAKKALLARGSGLKNLLLSEQLNILFDRTHWLDESITQNKTHSLREYLMQELEIPEIDAERFAGVIDENFIKEQTDNWIIELYKFLLGRESLWKSKTHVSSEGALRSKPIIRLEDGSHMKPFDRDGKVQVYLPPSDEYIKKKITGFFNKRVKASIAKDKDAKDFLNKLGLREPDAISVVYEYILPKYRGLFNLEGEPGEELVSLTDNLLDIDRILKTLNKFSTDPRLEKLINDLQKTEFLRCISMWSGMDYVRELQKGIDQRGIYCCSSDNIYLSEKYTGKPDIEIFFDENEDIWVLEDIYKNKIDVETLKNFGCKSEIEVSYSEPRGGYVEIENSRSHHQRGLDGFDPNCEIEGLEWALENVTIEKSIIIWGLLKKYYKQIKGTVETAKRQDYLNAKREAPYSTMGKMLINNPWLYKKGNNTTPKLPSKIMLEDLSSEYNCLEAQMIANQLGFVTPVIKELKKDLDPAGRKLFETVEEVIRLGMEDDLNKLIKLKKESEKMRGEEETSLGIVKDVVKGLTSGELLRENGTTNGGWDGTTLEEIEEVAENYVVVFEENIEDAELITKQHIMQRSKIISKGNGRRIEPKEFLKDKYHGGHCQICNTLIDLGVGKKHFIVKRIKPKKHQRKWADEVWNLLCLCPNCYALVSHGRGNDFSNIPVVAVSAINGEVVPEPVEERNGDYYIINITLAGKNMEIFYHPFHLVKFGVLMKKSQDE